MQVFRTLPRKDMTPLFVMVINLSALMLKIIYLARYKKETVKYLLSVGLP